MSNTQIVELEKMLIGIEGELNTYQEWKNKGYQVQKGQKAIVKTQLWKQVTKKNKEGQETKKFYLVNASLFSEDQVEKVA